MSQRISRISLALAGAVSAGALASSAGAATINVGPENLATSGWSIIKYDALGNVQPIVPGYDATFVTGPGTPPIGTGSARLTTGADGEGAVKLSTTNFNGIKLADITQLSYSTFVTHNSGGTDQDNQQAPYIQIPIDYNNDGSFDERLFFEPVYQTGGYSMVAGAGPIPDQRGVDGAAPKIGVWETYDILNGGVWTESGGFSGPPLDTIAHILANFPNATIVNSATAGGFQVVAGFGGPTDWGSFDGNVDAVTLATVSGSTVYNFEASVPEPSALGLVGIAGLRMLARRRSRVSK